MTIEEFKYPIAAGVTGTLSLDHASLRYKQGLRKTEIPLAQIRGFGVRKLGTSLGIVASELVIRRERSPGHFKVHAVPFNPSADAGKQSLAALARRVPAADLTDTPWEQAARHLGVQAHRPVDRLMNGRALLGLLILTASIAAGGVMRIIGPPRSSAESIGQGIGILLGVIVGTALLVKALRRRT